MHCHIFKLFLTLKPLCRPAGLPGCPLTGRTGRLWHLKVVDLVLDYARLCFSSQQRQLERPNLTYHRDRRLELYRAISVNHVLIFFIYTLTPINSYTSSTLFA